MGAQSSCPHFFMQIAHSSFCTLNGGVTDTPASPARVLCRTYQSNPLFKETSISASRKCLRQTTGFSDKERSLPGRTTFTRSGLLHHSALVSGTQVKQWLAHNQKARVFSHLRKYIRQTNGFSDKLRSLPGHIAGAPFADAADAKAAKENGYFVGATTGRPRCAKRFSV